MADASTCALKLLVDAHLAKAIIGTGGSAVRKLKIESGVHSIHLSTFIPGGVDRTCAITGPSDTVKTAARLIAERQDLLPDAAPDGRGFQYMRGVLPDLVPPELHPPYSP